MDIIESPIGIDELKDTASRTFGDMVKAVVDIQKELIAIDAELHSDLEALFLKRGAKQSNLWGINLYPELRGDDFVEFDSMINIRPSLGNKSRGVDDADTRQKIVQVVNKWIKK